MSVSNHTVSDSERVNTILGPRLLPLQAESKIPIPYRDGGPLWGALGAVSDTQVQRWFTRYHPAWGVRTGLLDGLIQPSLLVLDIDEPETAPDWIDDADLFPWRVQTRRGVHLYGWTGEPLRTRRLPFGDLKAQRAYVVLHQPSGVYQPAPTFGSGQLPLWPGAILSDLLRTETETPDQAESPRPERPQTRTDASRRRFTVSPVSLPVGERNAGLFRRLCVAAGHDAALRGETARLTGLARWLNAGLDAPLPDGEIVKLAGQAATYSAGWESSTAAYSERQRERGQRSGEARRERIGDRDNQIRALRESGLSAADVARECGVSASTVRRVTANP